MKTTLTRCRGQTTDEEVLSSAKIIIREQMFLAFCHLRTLRVRDLLAQLKGVKFSLARRVHEVLLQLVQQQHTHIHPRSSCQFEGSRRGRTTDHESKKETSIGGLVTCCCFFHRTAAEMIKGGETEK